MAHILCFSQGLPRGINELDVYSYTGTLGTFGYMLAYMLMGLGTPILVRHLAPGKGIAVAALCGVTATASLSYVFYRNVYPIPQWPVDLMPWLSHHAWIFQGSTMQRHAECPLPL